VAVPKGPRNAPLAATVVLLVLGVAFVVIAALYLTTSAGGLPGFFPGHQAGSPHHHTKHGILAAVLAALFLVGAWMSLGRRTAAPRPD